MRDHAIFGGCLRSEIPLPELPVTTCSTPDWTFHRATGPLSDAEPLGQDSVDATIRVTCGRLSDGFRLHFDDTGVFDISARGRDIAWSAADDVPLTLVRADLLGGVFSIALHLQGLLCLHGSAVTLGNAAVAFLGTKGAGKSTLATALCGAGAALLTDDMLPIHPGPPAMAWPAAPAVRLREDSAHRLQRAQGSTHPQTGKYHLRELPDANVERRRVPLAAIYELAPVEREAGVPTVQRVRLTGPVTIATLLRHGRAGTAIGGAEAVNLFVRAGEIARAVAIYRLEIARDFDRLDEVVQEIGTWHTSGQVARPEPRAAATPK